VEIGAALAAGLVTLFVLSLLYNELRLLFVGSLGVSRETKREHNFAELAVSAFFRFSLFAKTCFYRSASLRRTRGAHYVFAPKGRAQ